MVKAALVEAGAHFEEAARRAFARLGSPIGLGNVHERLASVFKSEGRLRDAADMLREAARHGYRRGRLNALDGLARTAREEGEWTAAEDLYRQALDGDRDMEDVVGTVRAFDGLALSRGANAGPAAELAERVRSVQELERLRAGSDRHDV